MNLQNAVLLFEKKTMTTALKKNMRQPLKSHVWKSGAPTAFLSVNIRGYLFKGPIRRDDVSALRWCVVTCFGALRSPPAWRGLVASASEIRKLSLGFRVQGLGFRV